MLPLWIIDLTQNDVRSDVLASLLAGMSEHQQSFWHYSRFRSGKDGVPVSVDNAQSCNGFLQLVLAEGKKCFNGIQQKGHAFSDFQVCIIGDVQDPLTRSVYHVLPSLLRDRRGAIFSSHVVRGFEVTGILYLSSTLHQEPSDKIRNSCALFLEELNTLSSELPGRNFNNLLVCQDVQFRDQRFYPQLKDDEVAHLVFQYIVTIFFCGHSERKIFDYGNHSGRNIFSAGAASVYYNSGQHKEESLHTLLTGLIAEFKKDDRYDTDFSATMARSIFTDDLVSAGTVMDKVRQGCSSVEVDLKRMEEEADPHPVWDMFKSMLYTKYYLDFLKYLPARLVAFMETLSYYLRNKYGRRMLENVGRMKAALKEVLSQCEEKVLSDKRIKYPTLAQLTSFYEELKDHLNSRRKEICMQEADIIPVPEYLKKDYEHVRAGSRENTPKVIIDNLRKMLKSEPIVMSLSNRCFFLGIMLVFTLLPVLDVLSPGVINVGDVMEYKWIWIPVIFLLPFFVEFVIRLRRHFLRVRREKYRLLASILYEINLELAKRQMTLADQVYVDLLDECDRHMAKIEDIRKHLSVAEQENIPLALPETMFNQSLTKGSFMDRKLLSDESAVEAKVHLEKEDKRISQLSSDDNLYLLKVFCSDTDNLGIARIGCPYEEPQLISASEAFNASLKAMLGGKLLLKAFRNTGSMLMNLKDAFDLDAFRKMAGMNGMLVSGAGKDVKVLRTTEDEVRRVFPDTVGYSTACCPENCTEPFIFLSAVQELAEGLKSNALCNVHGLDVSEMNFALLMTMYYAYYREMNLSFSLAGRPVPVTKNELSVLEKTMGGPAV